MNDLSQQLQFILELDRLKAVYRKIHVKADNNRFENSAEHSWHIAMLAHTLSEYAEQPIDLKRVVHMLLIHDIVEIDAGDTFAFANQQALDDQVEKELTAAKRLFGLLPARQYDETLNLWLEFEQATTPDGQFAKAMDCVLPVFQNMNNNGGSWAQHKIKKSQVLNRNRLLASAAPQIWDYVTQQVDLAISKGWLIDDETN